MGRRERIAFLKKEIIKEQMALKRENNKAIKEKAIEFQKALRDKATAAERKLAMALAKSPLADKYEFQHIIYIKAKSKYGGKRIDRFYIADFCFPDSKIIIEVDGGYHYTSEQSIKDKERTRILENRGYIVLRISNQRILSANNFDSLILDLLNKTKHEDIYKKK